MSLADFTFRAAVAGALLLSLPASAEAQQLPRRGALGVALAPPPEGAAGVLVSQVLPGGTAAQMGVRQGDIIVALSGRSIAAPAELVALAGGLEAGAPLALTVQRDGRVLRLDGRAAERPRETYRGARVDYGAVPFRGGLIRDIYVAPEGANEPPVLFLIQGYTCASVEAPDPNEAYRQLGQALVDSGIAFYRVEKPGVGDSRGGVRCLESDYATELDAFRTAYRRLIEQRRISPDRIFMLGHSMGGLQAPMLAAEAPPRGVAVYGTVLRNWADYHRDISQFQDFLMGGADPAQTVARAQTGRDVFQRFYIERQEPAAIAAADPALGQALRDFFAWDGGQNMFSRHWRFAQDLAHLPLMAAWRDTRSNVLAIYGGSDLVALFDEDHRMIADVANHYRPGTGRYVEIADTGHGMDLIGTRTEVRARARGTGQLPAGPYNPEVSRVLVDWIRQSMERPPVRTVTAGPAQP